MMLQVSSLSVSYGVFDILKGIDFSLSEQQWLMIVGPNGAGKSTIVKAISQSIPYKGQILLDSRDLASIKTAEIARNLAILAQNHHLGYAFSVEEVVTLGRYAWSYGPFASKGDNYRKYVDDALEMTGMSAQRKQSVLTLSGGELQRTFLAQVFAQNPRILILDEPTNHLDLVYQKQTFNLIQNWLQEKDRAVISVVHDLSLAKNYGTHALLLDKGTKRAYGSVDVVFTKENLAQVYDMDVYDWMASLFAGWQ